MEAGREHLVTQAFVAIADALVDGREPAELYVELTGDCARILDVKWAGLLLADNHGRLQVMAASSEHAENLELFQVQCAEGPCVDCYHTGSPVLVPDLAAEAMRWSRFAPVAVEAGFASVHAIPMRLADTVLGALGLFGGTAGVLDAEDLALAQAFAHVASVALVAGRVATDRTILAEQLQAALDSRVVLEQAKGVLSQLGDLAMDQAFAVLRRYSRDHNRRLVEIAEAVVSRNLGAADLLAYAHTKGIIPAPTG